MKIGPKYKICRRLGSEVFEKCQTQKFALAEQKTGRNTKGRRGPRTNYAIQLLEKQKVRFMYGLTEEQFRRYVRESIAVAGSNPMDVLFQRLESRLDNVVYRMGLAKTRRMARQLVSHGHILVNGKKLNIPSYQVKEKDSVELKGKSQASPLFSTIEEDHKHYNPPTWLSFNAKDKKGTVEKQPHYDKTSNPFDLSKILEFYSR
jgi:small subunit ribosomal protein S4